MQDSFKTRASLKAGSATYNYYSLKTLEKKFPKVKKLPFSLRILLENLLRHEDGRTVTKEDIEALANRDVKKPTDREIAFHPARVLLQDFTGVPAVVDLAAMREAIAAMGGNPEKINPLAPADLVIDHSVIVDQFATSQAFGNNAKLEFDRNRERYAFLRWGQNAFRNFRVVPPDTGICHQVNLEYLASVVFTGEGNGRVPGHPRRDRQPHDDDQRARRPRLGRRRDRGRGRAARPAAVDAHPGGRRLQARREAARGRDGDRPRPHRHADAPQEGRRREVRRVLRPRRRGPRAHRPRHDREHGARVRRDDGLLPRRRRDDQVPAVHEPAAKTVALVEAYCKEQGLFRTNDSPEPVLHGHARAQPQGRRALARGPEAPAGPRAAEGHARKSSEGV